MISRKYSVRTKHSLCLLTGPMTVQKSRRAWRRMWRALLRSVNCQCHYTNWQRSTAPTFTPLQKVCFAAKDIPLRTVSQTGSPVHWTVWGGQGDQPHCSQLKQPASLIIHPTFNVSLVKPVITNPLYPLSAPSPPTWLIYGHPAYTAAYPQCSLSGRGRQFLVDWEGYRPEVPQSLILDRCLVSEIFQRSSLVRGECQCFP